MEVHHLIGGDWRPASDGSTFESRDPHDGTLLAIVPKGIADDATAAITAARKAFEEGRMAAKWRAGTLWINTFFERDLRLPCGGEGGGGLGREGGQYSRDFFTEPRAVTLRLRG